MPAVEQQQEPLWQRLAKRTLSAVAVGVLALTLVRMLSSSPPPPQPPSLQVSLPRISGLTAAVCIAGAWTPGCRASGGSAQRRSRRRQLLQLSTQQRWVSPGSLPRTPNFAGSRRLTKHHPGVSYGTVSLSCSGDRE